MLAIEEDVTLKGQASEDDDEPREGHHSGGPAAEEQEAQIRGGGAKERDREESDAEEDDDLVLSDLHVGETEQERVASIAEEGEEALEVTAGKGNLVKFAQTITRYNVYYPLSHLQQREEETSSSSEESQDEDGDRVSRRKRRRKRLAEDEEEKEATQREEKRDFAVTLRHTLATPMALVGLQVWRGALLLSDFVLHHQRFFESSIALELGAGVGLLAVILARVCRHVVATDYQQDILTLLDSNLKLNSHIYKSSAQHQATVRRVDWLDFESMEQVDRMLMAARRLPKNGKDGSSCPSTSSRLQSRSRFDWSEDDALNYDNIQYLFASDVIYNGELVDGLFQLLRLLLTGSRTLFLCFEKRVNFSLADAAIVSPGYHRFLTHVCTHPRGEAEGKGDCNSLLDRKWTRRMGEYNDLARCLKLFKQEKPCGVCSEKHFIGREINIDDFPQYMQYEKVKELQLWAIVGA